MKKNWIMRVGVILMALTLITSCFVGGTFAKYVTTNTGTETARVAKWGVEIGALGATFADAYEKTGDAGGDKACAYATATATVKALTANDKIVAPGTKGTLVGSTVTGQPEVAGEIKYEVTDMAISGDWLDHTNAEYFPIKIIVNSVPYQINGTTINSFTDLKNEVMTAVAANTIKFDPKDILANKTASPLNELNISWEWAFEGGPAAYQTDEKDTKLGDRAAAATPGDELSFTLTIATTVTQID